MNYSIRLNNAKDYHQQSLLGNFGVQTSSRSLGIIRLQARPVAVLTHIFRITRLSESICTVMVEEVDNLLKLI